MERQPSPEIKVREWHSTRISPANNAVLKTHADKQNKSVIVVLDGVLNNLRATKQLVAVKPARKR